MKLKTFRIMALITGLLGSILLNRFIEGGTFFMSLILFCFLLSIYFLTRSFLSIKSDSKFSDKMLKLVNDSSVLGLTLGLLGGFIGLITVFDSIEATGDADPAIFAGGLKEFLLTTIFGLFTFAISRIGILVLRALQKK
ncbi:MAG: MotA/TolQ/ExbB proton channel family protein [Flavobacteriales bacterium]|jgi:hypothetical protein|tara:strand:- start:4386 stop:4802 length:417 start_codon:yes stop_codon:yes gene_type:complete